MINNEYADVTSANDDEKKKEAHKNVGEEIVNNQKESGNNQNYKERTLYCAVLFSSSVFKVLAELSMAEYLLPSNTALTISERQQLFAVKNRMVEIPANFPNPKIENICICGEKEDMKHIYQCETINDGEQPVLKYEKIFEGNICEQIEVFRKFERNIENRKNLNELIGRQREIERAVY